MRKPTQSEINQFNEFTDFGELVANVGATMDQPSGYVYELYISDTGEKQIRIMNISTYTIDKNTDYDKQMIFLTILLTESSRDIHEDDGDIRFSGGLCYKCGDDTSLAVEYEDIVIPVCCGCVSYANSTSIYITGSVHKRLTSNDGNNGNDKSVMIHYVANDGFTRAYVMFVDNNKYVSNDNSAVPLLREYLATDHSAKEFTKMVKNLQRGVSIRCKICHGKLGTTLYLPCDDCLRIYANLKLHRYLAALMIKPLFGCDDVFNYLIQIIVRLAYCRRQLIVERIPLIKFKSVRK